MLRSGDNCGNRDFLDMTCLTKDQLDNSIAQFVVKSHRFESKSKNIRHLSPLSDRGTT